MINERYLCFNLGTEEFGIPLLIVKEVLALPEITPIPFAPSHFVGIMNLRGQVISLIDMRSKFGIKAQKNNETSVIICDLETTSIGIIVDSIDSVFSPKAEELSPKPNVQGSNSSDYITSIYRNEGRMILILDINKTLNVTDKNLLAKVGGSSHRKAS